MKKITFCLALLAGTFGFAQDTCGTATPVVPGTILGTTITAATAGSEMAVTNGDTAGGGDSVWFAYAATADGTIDISTCLGGADTRLYVGTGTCGTLTVVANNDDTCEVTAGGNLWAAELTDVPVLNGTTYYIEFDDRWSVGPFDWTLTFNPAPPCGEVVTLNTAPGDVFVNFSWDAPAFGTPTGYNWEIQPDGIVQGTPGALATGVGVPGLSDTSGNVLTASTPYDLFIQTDCGVDGTSAYTLFEFTTTALPPPSNDLCAGATTISCGSVTAFDTTSASQEDATTCVTAATGPEVWFTYTEGGVAQTLSWTTCDDADFDTKIHVFSGACGALACETGNDDDPACTGFTSTATLTSTPGTTYYIKVSGFQTATGTGNLTMNCTTLGLGEFEQDSFKYFPNPVNDNLSLRAQSNIEAVSVYNMLGQEVKRMAPNAIASEVVMSDLSQGAYFVKVTINGNTETIRIIKK